MLASVCYKYVNEWLISHELGKLTGRRWIFEFRSMAMYLMVEG